MWSRKWADCVLVSALLLASCGRGGSGEVATGPTTSTTGSPAPSTTAARATSPADARAQAAVVQRADLPTGWREQAHDEQLDHETTWRALTVCLVPAEASEVAPLGTASAPTYETGETGTQVSSTVSYLDQARVQRYVEAFAGAGFLACAQKAFADDVSRNAPEGATASEVQVAPLPIPKLGQLTSAYRASAMVNIGIGGGSIKVPVLTDFVAVFNGTAVSRLTFISGGQPFPEELQRSLVAKVVERAGT